MSKILVLCVDRDDDLGKKAKIKGPVYGRENNLKAAEKLLLKDPEETDGNSIFAAIKKYDELKSLGKNVEIATITGKSKIGFGSDEELLKQYEEVLKKSKAKDIVFISDGAEDSSIIPLLQGKAKIISKETVVIKQAEKVESTIYTLKEVLKDKDIAKVVFGLPGFLFLILAIFGDIGLKIVGFFLGVYLLTIGFDVAKYIKAYIRDTISSFYEQRLSFLFYVASLFSLVFGILNTYVVYSEIQILDFNNVLLILSSAYAFAFLFGASILAAKITDLFHFKKAYLLRKYILSMMSLFVLWLVVVSGTNVLLAESDIESFVLSLVAGLFAFVLAYKITEPFDFTNKISRLLLNARVIDSAEHYLGRVLDIDKRKQQIIVGQEGSKEKQVFDKKHFVLQEGRVLIKS